MPRKRWRCPTSREEPDCILNVHTTTEFLSQERAEWVWVGLGGMHSSVIQLRTRPSRSRLFILRVPAVNSYFTVCGHFINQMIVPIVLRTDEQTHSMTIQQISEYMTQFGSLLTSWQTWVGCLPMCLMTAPQYLIHCVRSEVIQSHWLVHARPTWIGEKIPAPPRMPKDLCWRLPASFNRIFLGVFLWFLCCGAVLVFIFSPSKHSV